MTLPSVAVNLSWRYETWTMPRLPARVPIHATVLSCLSVHLDEELGALMDPEALGTEGKEPLTDH